MTFVLFAFGKTTARTIRMTSTAVADGLLLVAPALNDRFANGFAITDGGLVSRDRHSEPIG